jgi:hypothetical protein
MISTSTGTAVSELPLSVPVGVPEGSELMDAVGLGVLLGRTVLVGSELVKVQVGGRTIGVEVPCWRAVGSRVGGMVGDNVPQETSTSPRGTKSRIFEIRLPSIISAHHYRWIGF